MIDLILKLNCNFSDADKEECFPVIFRIIDLSKLARMKGILALELEMENEQNFFLKTAIELVVDGTDPKLVKEILQSIIVSGKYSGAQLLSRLIIAEGILSMQQGENPRIVELKLSALLGESYIQQINEKLSEREFGVTKFHNFLRTLKGKEALQESLKFEELLLKLDKRSIQTIFRNLSIQCLVAALYGCSASLIYKVSENFSMNVCKMICDEWEFAKNTSKQTIVSCQEEIIKKVNLLVSQGEIILINK